MIGDTAITRPMPKIRKAMNRLIPIADAASSRAPSQPSSTTSVAFIADWATLVRMSGPASCAVAAASMRHGWAFKGIRPCMGKPARIAERP